MLSCFVPESALAKPGSSNITHEPLFISLRLNETSGLSVFTRISVDTNFVLRARGGLRVSGGTSTGRRNDNTCRLLVNDPPVGQVIEYGGERQCEAVRPFQTNLRGTASYTEGIRQVDLRLAKNIRFSGKRVNIGADVFNVFNSNAATSYCGNLPNLDQGEASSGAAPRRRRSSGERSRIS
jgi:hypothetical protein